MKTFDQSEHDTRILYHGTEASIKAVSRLRRPGPPQTPPPPPPPPIPHMRNVKITEAEMCPAIVSGIVSGRGRAG